MLLPKDLLEDLESGDRTAEHLQAKEVPDMNALMANGLSAQLSSLSQLQNNQLGSSGQGLTAFQNPQLQNPQFHNIWNT